MRWTRSIKTAVAVLGVAAITLPAAAETIELSGTITDVWIDLPGGSRIEIRPFYLRDQFKMPAMLHTQGNLLLAPAGDRALLEVDELSYRAGGVATGFLTSPGGEVMGVEVAPFRWMAVDAAGNPAPNGTTAIAFLLNPGGEVMGVDPAPWRILLVDDRDVLGRVDFSQVTGSLGSLHLEGVRIELDDGSFIDLAPLEIFAQDETVIPTMSEWALMILAMVVLGAGMLIIHRRRTALDTH